MNQAKNNNVDARSDKRERRRVPTGRAAVLRRAPSDSDCSGETASLSADSGDRVARPVLPPPRAAKSRRLHISVNSRRRGSEWEVLEGLKDGQRFEKRPDVFNGYLHKKRKWPLKGWHKRFFVVDGGILVYARSPADVARGRLHGSVDVGLSVISAKARRRRIDIDADEFIYHLRAKTPELFRTWLNVLKAHRLYRQHLLTFGVRESAPKIHAPNDDLQTTDTSSHTSFTSETSPSNTTITSNDNKNTLSSPLNNDSSVYCHKADSSICNWQRECISKCDLEPLNYEKEEMFDLKFDKAIYKNHSLCSMNCIARKFMNLKKKLSPGLSMNSTDAEQQMICTDLDLNSLRSNDLQSSLLDKLSLISSKNVVLQKMTTDINNVEIKKKQSLFVNKVPTTTACYFFTRKKRHVITNESVMRNSKKCTNLVKYKNMSDEPPLKTPTSKCMLLGKYKLKASKHSGTISPQNKAIACETLPKESEETQDEVERENKASQNAMTSTDYDRITEKLMISIFQKQTVPVGDDSSELKYYIDRVVKDLYDVKVDQDAHPVKALFRCLLEYWLKNTSVSQFKEAMTSAKSIERQSNKYFTRDENLSSVFVHMISKETQLNRVSDLNRGTKTVNPKPVSKNKREKNEPIAKKSPRRDTESFEKEKRIQELERLLKNTVYICETQRNNKCREKDINITKKLINNLEKISKKPNDSMENQNMKVIDKSVSSTELPEIQDTINNLITETAIPPDFAKEFLGAYLDVLLHDESKSTITSQSSDWSAQSRDIPVCEVQAESIIKKVSRSITTEVPEKSSADHKKPIENVKQIDPGQVYLKDVLDKITTIFTKVNNTENRNWEQNKVTPSKQVEEYVPNATKDELGRPVKICSMKNFIYENCDEKSLVIDLSKYNLEHIAMFNDPAIKGIMSITIKLREKPSNSGESKQTHLNLKFADEVKPIITPLNKSDNWMSLINDNSGSRDIFNNITKSIDQPYIDFEANKELIDIKPYLSASDATSKAYRFQNDSDHSIGSLKSNDSMKDIKATEDPQSCYIMSFKKNAIATKFQSKKKVKLKHDDDINIKPKDESPSRSPTRIRPEELTVFEKPTPRIIDEKFILLLLENLMQLSKNVPTLFKDINCLYMKLRKKHDKVLKNCSNIQGLSLLGKIYNDESYVNGFNDKTTQIDSDLDVEVEKDTKDNKNCGTNTIRNVADKEIDTISLEKDLIVHQVPEREYKAIPKLKPLTLLNEPLVPKDSDEPKASSSNKERMTVTQTETMDIDSIDHATSIPNWFCKLTKDTAISTIIKYVFDNDGTQNFKMTAARPIKIEREQLKKKRYSPKMRQNLIKEITLLSPSFKVSTQSQTENHVLYIRTERKKEKDFNVYQLFLSRQFGLKGSSSMTVANVNVRNSDDMHTVYRCASDPSNVSGLISPTSPTLRGPQAGFVSGTPGGRLAGWIIESGGPLENATRELGQAQLSVQQLQRLLDALELQQQVHHDTDVSLDGASPNVKKDRRKFGLRKKKSSNKCASVELAPPHIDPSSSHTALSTLTAPPSPGGGASSIPNLAASLPIACAAARPQSLPGAESMVTIQAGPAPLTSLTPDHQLREDFTVLAKDLVASLKGVVSTLVCERSRLRAAMEAADSTAIPGNASMAALRTNLTSALQQNSELRSRLSRIHDASDLAEITDPSQRAFQQSLSYSSSCVSASEFFDAEEHEDDDDDLKPEVIAADEAGVIELDGDSSSEAGSLSSEEGSASSDNSEGAMLSAEAVTLRHDTDTAVSWTRRTRLPTPRPAPGGPSLWNLLYKNIGKDLSQISMPVTINEPLNMLQRLCEELEYSELLDAAAEAAGSERMALVAAFAVSAYAAAAHRAASKPFNPLLAETYECVRDDRGFRFLAEQVSHHPPISACHAESPRWCFWQETRIKTKFWGKSMEFQPTGRVHVRFTTTGDHYTWNKVTTCVHNLFGGQRWVDQYGDMHITCVGTDITCKLNFIKASSWSQSRHEVRGVVTGARGARLRLAGRWSEALHAGEPPAARCLWRPGAMPPEHELYYGFTRFAMELNELEPGMRERLPRTDTRLRPDQRALEEGLVDSAEQLKHELEQSQRERRRDSTQHTPAWFRKVTEEGEETWVFSGEYWKAREAGFNNDALPRIW